MRDDVEGVVLTGRPYTRIICVTAQLAKAKTRAELEQTLTQKYGVPVTIHDRSWIVEEVIDGNRKDLAFNYLGIGQEVVNARRMGPSDYSRLQQLEDIEHDLRDNEAYQRMTLERATDALVAANLSRGLERPRAETDGRFARATRLAETDGSFRLKLEIA